MRKQAIAILTAIILALPLAASADLGLFGCDQNGNLFSIDISTVSATFIGHMPISYHTTEIEYDFLSGKLYAADNVVGNELHVIHPTTGDSLEFVNTPTGGLNGLEFVGSTLYATFITDGRGPSSLVIVDTSTGSLRTVGLTDFGPISGLAYDAAMGIMYGITAGGSPANLVTIDLSTGAAALVGPTGLVRIGSIEFGDDGNLYGGSSADGTIVQLNTSTGAATLIGNVGYPITGLTLAELPAPIPTYSCAGIGFEPPFDDIITLNKKNKRQIPVKMFLVDDQNNLITDEDVSAPPVVNVIHDTGAEPIPDYNPELVPPGLSDDENKFRFDPIEGLWIINLATKQFTASGQYTVTAVEGDSTYVIDSSCIGIFIRLP